jgi:hypothetical protein
MRLVVRGRGLGICSPAGEIAAEIDVPRVVDLLPLDSVEWWVLQCLAQEVYAFVLSGEPGQPTRVCIMVIKYCAPAAMS